MKTVLDYLGDRGRELSSILGASGALGVLVLYLSGEMTGRQALAGAAAAVVAYLYPQAKRLPVDHVALVLGLIFLTAGLSACAGSTAPDGATLSFAEQVKAFDARAKTDLKLFGAASLVVGKSACGYVSEASGLFKVVAPIAGADPAALATAAAVTLATEAACAIIDAANPDAPATPQVAMAVSEVLAAVPAVKAALAAADPTIAAVASAP